MEINRAAFGALAALGIVAAGGGAYMASRHNETIVVPPPLHGVPVAGAVTETETAIAPAPPIASLQPSEVVEPAQPVERNRPQVSTRQAPARVRTAPAADRRPAPDRSRTAEAPAPAPTNTPAPATANTPVAATIEPVESTVVERAPVFEEQPRKPSYDELVIPADSVIGLQVETAVSTETAKVEDQVRARVTRDVRVRDQVAIPAGARAEGSITLVERGGRLKDQARLGIRFHTIVLADGTKLPINTETIYREGESPARESAAKIGGGAVGGAVLGAIFGGKKGAVIGSTVGAAGGGVAVATSQPNPASLPAGSTVTVRMGSPATVTVER